MDSASQTSAAPKKFSERFPGDFKSPFFWLLVGATIAIFLGVETLWDSAYSKSNTISPSSIILIVGLMMCRGLGTRISVRLSIQLCLGFGFAVPLVVGLIHPEKRDNIYFLLITITALATAMPVVISLALNALARTIGKPNWQINLENPWNE